MDFFVHIDGERLHVQVDNGKCLVDGEPVEMELASGNGTPIRSASAAGQSLRVRPRHQGRGAWRLDVEGSQFEVEVLDPGQEAIRRARKVAGAGSGPAPLKAPMPGLVVRVEVAEGDLVEEGQGMIIVEAMKMENELRAPAAARVSAVSVSEGMAVEKDMVLIEFEALESVEAEEEEEA